MSTNVSLSRDCVWQLIGTAALYTSRFCVSSAAQCHFQVCSCFLLCSVTLIGCGKLTRCFWCMGIREQNLPDLKPLFKLMLFLVFFAVLAIQCRPLYLADSLSQRRVTSPTRLLALPMLSQLVDATRFVGAVEHMVAPVALHRCMFSFQVLPSASNSTQRHCQLILRFFSRLINCLYTGERDHTHFSRWMLLKPGPAHARYISFREDAVAECWIPYFTGFSL